MLVFVLDAFEPQIAEALHITFTLIDPPYAVYGGLQYINRVCILYYCSVKFTVSIVCSTSLFPAIHYIRNCVKFVS